MMSTDGNDDIARILHELSGLRRRISRLECALQAHNIPLPEDGAPTDADVKSARQSIDVHDPILDATVSSGILQHLMPHQLEGTSFLLQNLLMNRGCILADAMGLGKSLQTLVALHAFFRQCRAPSSLPFKPAPLPDSARILMIAPLTVHPQWINEVDRLRVWLLSGNTHTELPVLLTLDSKCGRGVLCKCRRSEATLDSIKNQSDPVIDLIESDESDSSDAEMSAEQIQGRVPNKGFGLLHEHAIVEAWAHSSQGNCILMLNYHTALRLLDLSRAQRHRSRLEVRQLLLKQTNVLVLDEAHHIRNRKGNTHEAFQCAFSNVHRRISLSGSFVRLHFSLISIVFMVLFPSGYPLQNSMNDLYSLLHFSRPLGIPELLIGDPNMFQEKFVEPFKKTLEPSLFPTLDEQIEHRLSLSMASEFRRFLKSTHVFLRRGPELLERTLKGRSEYVIRCRMPPLQHFIYSIFIACARQQRMHQNRFEDLQDQSAPSDLDGLLSFGITAQDIAALPSSDWMNQNFMHMVQLQ
jgi:SNF2 family DNA or RNA helicase